ncbi:MAG: glycerophosphodiester phosphodiesterase [Lachnospiraceae bacterium]|nr:glycerophosphodiester phosphodiesterase [Lachnospiraceae bacterium]
MDDMVCGKRVDGACRVKTEIWGHRGASGYAPENTLEAFELALLQGADGVELDVQLTKDDELVVIHDERIDRTSNGSGFVRDYTLEELKKLNFNKTIAGYRAVQIPTLKEVYELFQGKEKKINVEIKTGIFFYPGIEEKLLELTAKMSMEEQVLYSSFNHQTLLNMKKLNPKVYCGILYSDGYLNMDTYCQKLGMDALHPALYNLQYEGFREACREKKIPLHVWTVNEPEHIKLMRQMQVEAIITNYPDR